MHRRRDANPRPSTRLRPTSARVPAAAGMDMPPYPPPLNILSLPYKVGKDMLRCCCRAAESVDVFEDLATSIGAADAIRDFSHDAGKNANRRSTFKLAKDWSDQARPSAHQPSRRASLPSPAPSLPAGPRA